MKKVQEYNKAVLTEKEIATLKLETAILQKTLDEKNKKFEEWKSRFCELEAQFKFDAENALGVGKIYIDRRNYRSNFTKPREEEDFREFYIRVEQKDSLNVTLNITANIKPKNAKELEKIVKIINLESRIYWKDEKETEEKVSDPVNVLKCIIGNIEDNMNFGKVLIDYENKFDALSKERLEQIDKDGHRSDIESLLRTKNLALEKGQISLAEGNVLFIRNTQKNRRYEKPYIEATLKGKRRNLLVFEPTDAKIGEIELKLKEITDGAITYYFRSKKQVEEEKALKAETEKTENV